MELTVEQIVEAIQKNPELTTGIMPTIENSEIGKKIIGTKVDTVFNSRIDEKVKEIHKQYDDDLFQILGERPGQNEDGSKQKTYDKLKTLYEELKGLRSQKEGLTKDAEVQRLMGEIEKLKQGNGATELQATFDSAKAKWLQAEEEYKNQIKKLQDSEVNYLKDAPINEAVSQIKFTPETPENIKKLVIDSAKAQLKQASEIRDGKLVFLKEDGSILLNAKYEPMTAFEKIMTIDSIKDISLKEDQSKGGGARQTIEGSIITTNVEGKDVKKLNIAPGSFKTKAEFLQVAEKALTDAGFTMRDKEWNTLKNEAYKEHEVSKLPRQ